MTLLVLFFLSLNFAKLLGAAAAQLEGADLADNSCG